MAQSDLPFNGYHIIDAFSITFIAPVPSTNATSIRIGVSCPFGSPAT
jgi:hypothetical protein